MRLRNPFAPTRTPRRPKLVGRTFLVALLGGACLWTVGFLAAQDGTIPGLPGQQPPLLPGTAEPGPVLPGTVLPGTAAPKPAAETPATPAEPTGLDPDIDFNEDDLSATISVEVLNILVPVTVTDRRGNFVNGLTPLDFQLLDNGIPQRITEDVAAHPISLVVAVQADATAQMLLPTISKVSSMFDSLVIGETGEMAVLAFDHRIQELTNGFTSDPDEIKEAFSKFRPGSSTHKLNDAAMHAVRMLRNRPSDRKRILLLISETRDKGSEVDPRDVMTEIEFDDVVVFSIDMNHFLNQITSRAEPNRPNPIPPEARPAPMGIVRTGTTDAQMNMGNYTPIFKEIFALVKGIFIPNPLEVYTTFSGGKEHNFASQGGLEEAIAQIGAEIHSQYLLSFRPPRNAEGGYHEIEVRVLRPEMEVRSRPGYWIAPREADAQQSPQ